MSSSLAEVSPCPTAYMSERPKFWQDYTDPKADICTFAVCIYYSGSFHMMLLKENW